MALEAMDVLAGWAEIQAMQMERITTIAMGVVMFKLGERHIEISAEDIKKLLAEYYPQAEGDLMKGVKVTLTRITDLGSDPAQGNLALEVTSE